MTGDAEVWPRRLALLTSIVTLLLLQVGQPAKCSYNSICGALLSFISYRPQ